MIKVHPPLRLLPGPHMSLKHIHFVYIERLYVFYIYLGSQVSKERRENIFAGLKKMVHQRRMKIGIRIFFV